MFLIFCNETHRLFLKYKTGAIIFIQANVMTFFNFENRTVIKEVKASEMKIFNPLLNDFIQKV